MFHIFILFFLFLTVPTSGFAYSLEALSEDEDGDEEENEEGGGNFVTPEQMAAAVQVSLKKKLTLFVTGTHIFLNFHSLFYLFISMCAI